MAGDIRAAVRECEICGRAAPRPEREPLQQPITPEKAWSRVSVDMMTLDGRDYLVTVDNLSGYLEIDRLRSQTASEVILKLRMSFASFGPPETLLSDNAPQFRFTEFTELIFTKAWGFKHETSSPHQPRSNGQAEAAVKVAKAIMKKAKAKGTGVCTLRCLTI